MGKQRFGKEEEKETQDFPSLSGKQNLSAQRSPLATEKGSKRVGKFVSIASTEVIVDVNGNGERIPYVKETHDSLKPGDNVELP